MREKLVNIIGFWEHYCFEILFYFAVADELQYVTKIFF